MWPVTIVMGNEHPEDALKMLAVRDQQPVQTLGPTGPNEPFRHLNRRYTGTGSPFRNVSMTMYSMATFAVADISADPALIQARTS